MLHQLNKLCDGSVFTCPQPE